MPESDIELISPKAAAFILKVSTRTVTRWADDPDGPLHIASWTEGGQRRFSRAAVEQLAADLATAS